MSDIDPNKLKVTELREELKARGLDTKGTKPVLVKRLKKALNEEKGSTEAADESLVESGADDSQDTSNLDDSSQEPPVSDTTPVKSVPVEESEEQKPEPMQIKEPEASVVEAQPEPKPEPTPVEDTPVIQEEDTPVIQEEDTPAKQSEEQMVVEEESEAQEEKQVKEEVQGNGDVPQDDLTTVEEVEDEGEKDEKRHRRKRSHSRSRSRSHERRRSRSRERRRSRSRERRRSRSPKKVVMEDETWESSTNVILDRFNSDLSLTLDETNMKATPMTDGGFAMMWSGARATYGVKGGKVAFEVKLTANCDVVHLPEDELHTNVARIGWSTDSTSMNLGEEALSYGYGGTAKAATECKFEDYGQQFGAGDVIGAYVDFDADEGEAYISFAKNGDDLGICFQVEKSKLGEAALFPHILSKNVEFECNFGAQEEPWFPLKEEYVFIEQVPLEERVRGTTPPAKKEDCEMIMMIGLPGSGKTVWAEKHKAAETEKRFNVLGTNFIIDKMKVMGLPRKRNYSGRWDILIDKSTRCLNKMFEVAASKKRNYILDQTNVYASARRRKMQPFEGFQRKAVVIVPTDEEFKRRIEQREKEEGKDVPERAVLEMKANFSLPEEGVLFDSVEFVELDRTEATELLTQYNKEGKEALPPPQKRSRFGDRFGGRDRDHRDHRSGGHDRYGGRGGGGGWKDNRRGGQNRWGGGGGGGGGRDRQGGYNRNDGGRFGGGGGYGGGGGGGGRYRNDRWSGGGGGGGGGDRRNQGGNWRDRNQGRSMSGGSGGGGGGGKWNSGGGRWSSGGGGGGGSSGGSGSGSGGGSSSSVSRNSQGSYGSSQGSYSGSQGSYGSSSTSNQGSWNSGQGSWGSQGSNSNWNTANQSGYGQWNYAQGGQNQSWGQGYWPQYNQQQQYNQQYQQWYQGYQQK